MATTAEIRHWEYYVTTGSPVVGANVYLREASLTHPNAGAITASTTTNADGMWVFTGLDDTKYWDVEVAFAGVSRWYKGLSRAAIQLLPWNQIPATANTVLAGAGAGAAPTFRALTNTDLPNPITKDLKTSTTIVDANGNSIIGLSPVASAVNYVQVNNNIALNNPALEAKGASTDVGLNLITKGAGVPQWAGATLFTAPAAWTPTLTQAPSGVVTFTITEARWFQIYKTVFMSCRCVVASVAGTATAGNAMIFGGMPIAQRSGVGDKVIGSFYYYDNSAGTPYNGILQYSGSVTTCIGFPSGWLPGGIGVSPSIAPGANDIISLLLQYEVA